MSTAKKLSIIIPHYNSPQYLRTLISSIPNIPNIQVIVVDDKSTMYKEEYDQLRNESVGKNVEFYDNETVKSAGACRNIGLQHAAGEWLLFADADDYFMEGFYDVVSSYVHSDYDIVFFMPTSVVLETKEVSDRHLGTAARVKNYYDNPDWKNELVLRYWVPSPCAKLVRKEMVLKNGICFEEIIAANDVMFSVKCGYAAKKIAVDTRVIYCITKHKGSLTAQWSEEVLDARIGAFLRQFSFLKERLSQKEMNALQMNEGGYNMLFQLLQRGYPLRKIVKVLKAYYKCGIKIRVRDLLTKPWHYLHIIFDNLRIRKKTKNIQPEKR